MDINKVGIPLAIVVAAGLIAGSLYFSNIRTAKILAQKSNTVPTTQGTNSLRPVSATDHIRGNPDARVVIVEYSDTECPYCKIFHESLQRIMAEYGKDNKVAWVYRHFPIAQLHSRAPKEAEATECVNELGGPEKFWQYLNMIYSKTDSNDTLDPKLLPVFAKTVGVDVTAFNTCLSSGKYASKIQADYDDAMASGGQGTPHTIFVTRDGVKTPIDGALSYDSLKSLIDAMLQ
ncbi:MAG: thioredoxin domain-containing protein [Patescibacteria group bacterium]